MKYLAILDGEVEGDNGMHDLSHPSPYDAVDLNNVVMFDVPPPEVQDPPPLQINNKLPSSDIAELSCGETNTQTEKSHLFEMDLRIRGDQCSPDKHTRGPRDRAREERYKEVVGTLHHINLTKDIKIMIRVDQCLPVRGASGDPMC